MENPTPTPRQKLWLTLTALSAAAGLIDSILIHLKEIDSASGNANAFVSCSISALINCESVAKSVYSHFAGMPVSLLGIMFYVAVITGMLAYFFGLPRQTWMLHAVSLGLVLGLLFSIRLLYYSYFGLGALCPYCLVSDAATLLVTIFWLLYAYEGRRRPAR